MDTGIRGLAQKYCTGCVLLMADDADVASLLNRSIVTSNSSNLLPLLGMLAVTTEVAPRGICELEFRVVIIMRNLHAKYINRGAVFINNR